MMSGPEAIFRDFLTKGQFMIQRARSSGKHIFPPRLMMPGNGDEDLEWIESSGRGTIYSFTVVALRNPADDYNICLVDLDEGPRLLARLTRIDHEKIYIGLKVQVVVDTSGDEPLLVLEPAEVKK